MSQFGSHGDNDEEEHDHSRDEGAGRRGRRGGCAAVDGGRRRLRLPLPGHAASPAAYGVLDGRLAVAVLEHMFTFEWALRSLYQFYFTTQCLRMMVAQGRFQMNADFLT